jgi:hypothetical protein
MAGQAGKAGWKIFGTLSAILAAVLARKVMTLGWKAMTGNEPPSNPEHPDVEWGEAVSWAVASGVAVGVARLLAQRKAAQTWRKASGSLPPGFEELTA